MTPDHRWLYVVVCATELPHEESPGSPPDAYREEDDARETVVQLDDPYWPVRTCRAVGPTPVARCGPHRVVVYRPARRRRARVAPTGAKVDTSNRR